MRLLRIQEYLKANSIQFEYTENDDCGGIEFVRRGLAYHIWEYPEPERGASSNVRTWGRMEDYEDDYEEKIIEVMRQW